MIKKTINLLLLLFVFIPYSFSQDFEEDTLTISKTDTISIIGVGDMMLGTNYPDKSYLPPNDGKDILSAVAHILRDADVTFGNLEGVLLTALGNPKKCNDPKICYAFKSPDHYVKHFKEAGFDVVSIANNHVGDFGTPGTENTVRLLQEEEIYYAGLTTYPYTTFTIDDVRYGFCAFAPNYGTVSIHDYKNAQRIVSLLDSISDIVIVSFHGGAEGQAHNRITRKGETFIGENRGNPYEFARKVIDAGADIVFGHGPHVIRAIDIYKDRFIAYSLGNFATYGRFNISGISGYAPIVKVYVDKTGKFLEAEVFSARQYGEGGPVLDENQSALKEIKRLTKLDIPEAGFNFRDDGKITVDKK